MISKLVILALIVGIIYFFIFPKFRSKNQNKNIENFVECEKCSTYVSIKDAIIKDGKYICKDCIKDSKCK